MNAHEYWTTRCARFEAEVESLRAERNAARDVRRAWQEQCEAAEAKLAEVVENADQDSRENEARLEEYRRQAEEDYRQLRRLAEVEKERDEYASLNLTLGNAALKRRASIEQARDLAAVFAPKHNVCAEIARILSVDEGDKRLRGPRCGGAGEIAVGTRQDSFGNWDVEESACPGCPDCLSVDEGEQ